jgi:hypothetical protein
LESAGAGFKIGEGSYLANLNNKPRITALATDKKTGIITHWHNNRPPGWYLVLLPGPAHRIPQGSDSWSVVHEGYYDWKWVELTGPTSQVAADLTVDPANLGTVAVTVSNAPAQASVTYLPLRADGKLPWPEAHYYLHGVSSVGVTNGQAAIRYLREGRYQLALINKDRWGSEAPVTTDVEVKRGMTTKAELISKEPVKPVPITQPKPVTPTPAPTKPVAPVTPSIPAVKPTAPVGNTKNLLLTAKMSASSMWSSDFAAGKAADGNGSSRWNSKPNDDVGAWLAARWDQPVTIRKIVIRQAYDRLIEFTMQRFDAAKNDWVDMMHVFPNRHTSSFSPTGEKLGWSVHPDDVYVDGRRLADCKERKFAQADPNAAVNPVFTLNLRGAPATTGIRLVAKQVNGITISIFEMEAW